MFGFGRGKPQQSQRQVVELAQRPDYVYAVGDIHGCFDALKTVDAAIAADIASHGRQSLVVYLGDLIDRGPNSFAVIEHFLARSLHPRVILTGNHEDMFLDFLAAPHPRHAWLEHGGVETLQSYGLDPTELFDGGRRAAANKLISYIPAEHISLLENLPVCVSMPGLTMVHAGLRPGLPLTRQSQQDMMWLRLPTPAFAESQPFGLLVHGHTPNVSPLVEPYRICIDTGAFATGLLTAIRIDRDNKTEFITSHNAANRNDNA